MNDLRFAFRQLLKNPGFTAVAVLTLALGIGANTAIFSVVNAVLLRPLPFRESERLMLISGGPAPGWDQTPLSFADFTDLREQSQTFAQIASWTSFTDTRFSLTGGDQPEEVQFALVSANFFATLGVTPVLGRGFLPSEDQPGKGRTVLVSHRLWERRFGPNVALNRQTLILDGNTYEIAGVLPPGFRFVTFPKDPDIWVPLALDPLQGRKFSRGTKYLGSIGRLKPEANVEQARTELATILSRLQQQFPSFYQGRSFQVMPLHEQVTRHLRQALLVLFGAIGFVLLIACANVANLLLARARARGKEMAVRAALGASRRRIARQLLTESVVLAALGGGLGLLFAFWGTGLVSFLTRSAPNPFIPFEFSREQFNVDGQVLGFTLLVSLLTGIAFGLVPAWQASRRDLNEALKQGGATTASGSPRSLFRNGLVVGEVAVTLTLLIGAGLLLKSFARLQRVDPGFEPQNVLSMDLNLPRSKYADGPKITAFYEQLLERISRLPGVTAVGATEVLPLSGSDESTGFFIEGQPLPEPSQTPHTHQRAISPDYFKAMGIPVRQGRAFTAQDSSAAPRVAIINETMAKQFWPGESPVGKRFALDFQTMRYFPDRPPERDLQLGLREIVGVVADVKHSALNVAPAAEAYIPSSQMPSRDLSLVVRTASDPTTLMDAVRKEVLALDPDQPASNVRTMIDLVTASVAQPRSYAQLLGAFSCVALLLAMVGLYGVIAYSVTQRTREIGLRLALGAQQSDVLGLVLQQGMKLVLVGVGIGLIGAFGLTRLIGTLLYGVSARDPLTFAVVAVALISVALLACWLPARRAARVDPMEALRCE